MYQAWKLILILIVYASFYEHMAPHPFDDITIKITPVVGTYVDK